ncbi:WD-repeat protein [Minicystis rosea]|nr:WD-repeat protein [Minicystis rosea]
MHQLLSASPQIRQVFGPGSPQWIEHLALAPSGLDGVLRLADGQGQDYQPWAEHWNVEAGAPTAMPLKSQISIGFSVAFSADGRYVALPAAESAEGLVLWDRRDGGERRLAVADGCSCAAFHPGGALLAAGTEAGELFLWDLAEHRIIRTLDGGRAQLVGLAFSPSGSLLVGSSPRGLSAWDPREPACLLRDDGGEVDGMFYLPAFSPDGRRVALGSAGGQVLLHDGATAARVALLRAHEAAVFSVAFDPSSQVLATAGINGVLCFWDAAHGEPLGALTMKALMESHGLPVEDTEESAAARGMDSPYLVASVSWTRDAGLVLATHTHIWRWPAVRSP